jgi:hypothetical protein
MSGFRNNDKNKMIENYYNQIDFFLNLISGSMILIYD